MTHSDFEPGIERHELDALLELSDRLCASRPVPSPAFRGALGRTLAVRRSPSSGLRLRITTCLVSGTALLLVALLGVTGAGPLAPQPLAPAIETAGSSVSR